MAQIDYELGGIKTFNLGRLNSASSSQLKFRNGRSEVSPLSDPASGRSHVRSNGVGIRPLLYWGFFSVMALSVISTLINNTQFSMIGNQVAKLESISTKSASDETGRQLNKDLAIITDVVGRSSRNALLLALLTIFTGLALSTYIGRKLSGQVNDLSQVMYELAKGRLDIDAQPRSKVGPELANMYDAVNVFKSHAKEVEQLRLREIELRGQQTVDLRNNLLKIASVLDEQIVKIFEGISRDQKEMLAAADGIEKLSLDLRNTAEKTSTGMDLAASNVEQVTASTQQLSKQFEVILAGARNSKDLSASAVLKAKDGNLRIKSLEEQAVKIEEMLKVIQSIAAKTNMLALNATIEAARGGSAGRGFAVVAGEVKSLAAQTADAAKLISGQIEGVRAEISLTVDTIQQISTVINELSVFSSQVAENVVSQAAATQQISSLVERVALEINAIGSSMKGLAENAEQKTIAVSESISTASRQTSASIELMGKNIGDTLQQLTGAA
ncbi:methyl-accepting chemotaxis protein [Tardiphaga sp. vice278]|uniref:methyl-accepting chemotaxis protein n=1 Tax=Tardiphaga sp. vice278 TaxID=2592815 RepID=UPI00143CEF56|nr:methyl-accepting chemotaxis protein [Tardiphaga sp. vice278]